MSPRDSALQALMVVADRLGHDELLVLGEIADRLVVGEETYGPLNLDTPRDWRREGGEELLDYLVYRACGRLAKAREL